MGVWECGMQKRHNHTQSHSSVLDENGFVFNFQCFSLSYIYPEERFFYMMEAIMCADFGQNNAMMSVLNINIRIYLYLTIATSSSTLASFERYKHSGFFLAVLFST